ncbi:MULTISPECIES: hypothetical protein [Streptomyces]|uniref:hypothetical protein n=1 Tax=Streptomyces TaxID=1883 RepID=UPI0021560CA3|nr:MULTISPECIES: hypothetical protein [unclassified Streptomyces]
MRNPVGPLPSSIYWRRRAVAALVIALLAALVVWAVTSTGGGGKKSDDAKTGDASPAPSTITPGPSSSDPVVGQPPGGRDESGDSGESGDTGADTGGGDAGTGGESGSGTGGPGTGGSSSGGSSSGGTGTGGGGTAGQRVPADSTLPNCTPSALRLGVKTENSFGPDDKPVFRLVAENTSASDCKADLGPKNVVLTVTEAGGDDERVWSSKDCPPGGAVFLKVPAGGTITHTVEWDRKKSAPTCPTTPPGTAAPGTYLLEAKAPGEPVQRASFVLAKD